MKSKVTVDDGEYIYTLEADVRWITDQSGVAFDGWARDMKMIAKAKEEAMTCTTPELYPENLNTLQKVMEKLPIISFIEGVFSIEVRVKVDDISTWAVVGWGESGDPCILRFEKE